MAKVNTLHQEMAMREFEEAYAQHLADNDPADALSEGEFADYWHDKQHEKEAGGQFGHGA